MSEAIINGTVRAVKIFADGNAPGAPLLLLGQCRALLQAESVQDFIHEIFDILINTSQVIRKYGDAPGSRYQKLDFTDVSLVTIGFGVNDARTAVPLGSIGSYTDTSHDTATFYGAYRTLLDKIYTDNPECRVILLTPLQRLFVTNFGCDTENANGCKLIDFVDAIIEIGQMYATPVCDMYRNSGLNQKNLAYYTTEGIHPEDVGYLRMANVVLNTMDKF